VSARLQNRALPFAAFSSKPEWASPSEETWGLRMLTNPSTGSRRAGTIYRPLDRIFRGEISKTQTP
jgi:hypothetical protein